MTRKQARDLIGVEDRMFRYLMAAENVPTPCSVNGVLTVQAEAAVWRLAEKRRQAAVIAEPLPTPPPPVAEPPPGAWTDEATARGLERLHARNVGQDEVIAYMQSYLEATDPLIGEMVRHISRQDERIDRLEAALKRPGTVRGSGGFWRGVWAWLQQSGSVPTEAAQEQSVYPSTFEAWAEESVGGRRH